MNDVGFTHENYSSYESLEIVYLNMTIFCVAPFGWKCIYFILGHMAAFAWTGVTNIQYE